MNIVKVRELHMVSPADDCVHIERVRKHLITQLHVFIMYFDYEMQGERLKFKYNKELFKQNQNEWKK